MEFPRAKRFGPYALLEQIAVGGMAEIYLAKTKGVAGFEKLLALKVIHPNLAGNQQFVQMLIDEAKIAVSLNHTNIAQIYDLGQHGNNYYIAMEYIDGGDLFKIMRQLSEREVDVPVDVAAYIAQEICSGLDYAHRKRDESNRPLNIIHRDISPQNILLSHAGEVKIVDFGIAKAASRSRATQAGVIKGKYFYMSPEQAWGDPIDQRSDIFSAGIILYEVLTGQMLYLEEDMNVLLDMVRKADIKPARELRRDIPEELDQIAMKALAKDPDKRWQTARQFQSALAGFLYRHAPDFTPERVATVVTEALAEPSVAPGATSTRRVEVEHLINRDELPIDFRSKIFDLEDVGEMPGEKTRVSGPPDMFYDGAADPGQPTAISDVSQLHDPRARGRHSGLGDEVGRPQPTRRVDMQDVEVTPRADRGAAVTGQRQQAAPAARWPAAPHSTVQRLTTGSEDLAADDGPSTDKLAQPPAWPQVPASSLLDDEADEKTATDARAAAEPPTAVTGRASRSARAPHPRDDDTGEDFALPATPLQPSPAPPAVAAAHRRPPPPEPPTPSWPARPPGGASEAATAARDAGAHTLRRNVPPGARRNGPTVPPPLPPAAQAQPPPHGSAPATLGGRHQPGFATQPSGPPPAFARPADAGAGAPLGPPRSAPAQPPVSMPSAGLGGAAGAAGSQPVASAGVAQSINWPPPTAYPPGSSPPPLPAAAGPTGSVAGAASANPPRSARRWWLAGALVVIIAGSGLALALAMWPFGEADATIVIRSAPEGATVVVDGEKLSRKTPVIVPVSDTGQPIAIQVRLASYETWTDVTTFEPGEKRKVIIAPLAPLRGRLEVHSIPEGADMYIDGEYRGTTPTILENLALTEDLSFELRKRGYRTVRRTHHWAGKRRHKLKVKLRKSR